MSSIAAEESSTLTGSPVYRLKHTWTIKGFASTYLVKSSTDRGVYPKLYSASFSSSRACQTQFRLIVRPRGDSEKCQNSLSLYLEMKRSCASPLGKSADIKYKISLLNERNEERHSREFRGEFAYPLACWGWSAFLAHSELQEPASGLLPADTLTILLEMDVFPEVVAQLGTELTLAKVKVASVEKVNASLADILASGEHSDVLLVVEGGTALTAHKVILSAGSPVFRGMFQSEMAEQRDGKVTIPDMKEEAARAMLRFIYTGKVDDLAEYAEELLVAADKYDVALLKEQCTLYLCAQVDTENAARLFALADRHSVDQLKTVTAKYIRAHWEDVMTRPEDWKLVQDRFFEELRKLKIKEGEETEQDDKTMPQEESESAN